MILVLFAAIMSVQTASAGLADVSLKINKAMRFSELSEELTYGFAGRYSMDWGSDKSMYLAKQIPNSSIRRVEINLVPVSDVRGNPTYQLNVYLPKGMTSSQEAAHLELLVQKAMKASDWDVKTTQFLSEHRDPSLNRIGIGVGEEALAMRGADNLRLARFLENMAALTDRLQFEDITDVLLR